MKRLIVTGPREATFEDVPTPACPADGVLVRAKRTAISTGTEIRVFRGTPVDDAGRFLHESVPFERPTENGYSMVGEIVQVGAEAEGFSVGDRVFVPEPHKQFTAVPAELAAKLPQTIPDEEAVFLNILEVSHIALRRANPAPGENVAIIGQGVIGLSALAYCRMFGFRTAVVDTDQTRLSIASRMGADLAVSTEETGFVDRVVEFFDGEGADLVIEAASDWSAIRTSMQLARPEGKVIVVARHTDTPEFNPVGHPFLGKKLTLLTSYGHPADGHRWDRRRSFDFTVGRLARRELCIEPMVTHRFDWQQLPQVYHRLDQGDSQMVGIVIRW